MPVLWEIGAAEGARRAGLPERSVRRAIKSAEVGRTRASTIRRLGAVAAAAARERLQSAGIRVGSTDDEVAVELYARELEMRPPPACTCGCGRVSVGKGKWASEACRKRAARGQRDPRESRP